MSLAVGDKASVAVAAGRAAVDTQKLPGVCEQQGDNAVRIDCVGLAAVVTSQHPDLNAAIGPSRPQERPGMNACEQQQQLTPELPACAQQQQQLTCELPETCAQQQQLLSELPETPTAHTACKNKQPTPDAPSVDRTNLRFEASKYAAACSLAGRTPDFDAYAEPDGSNALTDRWCANNTFLQHDCSGQTVWLDPPEGQTAAALQHYHNCKASAPATTSALVVLTRTQAKRLHHLLGGMSLIAQLRAGTVLYTATRGHAAAPGILETTQVYYDPPCSLNASRLLVENETDPEQRKEVVTIEGDRSCLHYTGKVSGAAARIDIDSGATDEFMSERFARKNGLAVQPASRTVALADGNTVKIVGLCRARVRIGTLTDVITFYVLHLNSVYDILLGEKWLKKRQAILNFQDNSMTVSLGSRDSPPSVTLLATSAGGASPSGGEERSQSPVGDKCLLTALQFKRHMRKRGARAFLVVVRLIDEAGDTSDPQLNAITAPEGTEPPDPVYMQAQTKIRGLLERYKVVFSDIPPGVIRREGLPELTIETEDGKQPPVGVQYRLSPREKEELTRQLKWALEKGWIEPSSSPFGAPVLFAPKKDGGLRMCLDYRALNKITVKNRYPLPRIDDLLDQLNGATIFSGLDLASGYYQLPIKEDGKSKELTAFRTPQGLYHWTVVPMGLTNAPAIFQRTMQQVFDDMIGKFVLIYLDDILIYSKSPEEHELHVEAVLRRLQEKQFYAKESKCNFAMKEIEFLGHIVSGAGIRVDPGKCKLCRTGQCLRVCMMCALSWAWQTTSDGLYMPLLLLRGPCST